MSESFAMGRGSTLARSETTTLVGRLAPSPTGAQHLGNARTYLLAWVLARQAQGRLILRIEDIDSPRVKLGAAQEALADLAWLGLDWDEGPDCGGPQAPYVQTQRLALYREAFETLRAAERIYPCTCSRADVAAAASAPHVGQEGPIYPGTCAARRAGDAIYLRAPYCWRWRAADAARGFVDRAAGPQSANVARDLGDFVVVKADGTPAYQLAVVVDDHAMGVTQVVRGDDLLPSTFRQLELYDFFGWAAPEFCHVPLVVGKDGRRLAKRHGDTRLSQYRAAGVRREQIVGMLAWSCGWLAEPTPCAPRDLLDIATLTTLPRTPLVLTEDCLRALSP